MVGTVRTVVGGSLAVLAAVAFASVGSSSAAQSTAAGRCSVTPVIQSDIAIGAQQSLTGQVTIPVAFTVTGSCSERQLGQLDWDGASNDDYPVNFGYQAGPRPELVVVEDYEAGLVSVTPGPQVDGVVQGSTSFTIRDGAWLGEQPGEQPRHALRVQAQHFDPSTGLWAPLRGRVSEQKQSGARWITLRSAQLDVEGRAVLAVPSGQSLRFIVPGTFTREPAVYPLA